MNEVMMFGEQPDGSVIDIYGNVISMEERLGMIEVFDKLPISQRITEILDTIRRNHISVIQGETGSGKTTQVPKHLLKASGGKQRIIVTQPRVISAVSNASRVSQELLSESGNHKFSLGLEVGYRTGQGVSSQHTSPLSFHTDGLEIMRQSQGLCPDILVVDEVHNFSIATEILLMLAKYRKDVKIVIMSATLDPAIFQDYFSSISRDIPFIRVPGRTHEVKKYFNAGDNYVEAIATHYRDGKNILFFVPGKSEIQEEIGKIRKNLPDADIFPLHAELPKEQQKFLLEKKTEKPRIIVCTNIAEESITIPYIDIVFDLGTHKVSSFNSFGIEQLRLEDTSQANCLQRAGRAGRTKPGEYIRENDTPFPELDKYPVAPIERQMLDRYILVLLSQGMNIQKLYKDSHFTGKKLFLHGISPDLLALSYQRLEKIGAIDSQSKITNLGRSLLVFPLDVYQARILFEGIQRKCSEDMMYAAAIMERKGFLSKHTGWKKIIERRKVEGKNESDIFSYIELFKLLTSRKLPHNKLRLFDGVIDSEDLKRFQEENTQSLMFFEFINLESIGVKTKRLKEIQILVEELKNRLQLFGINMTNEGTLDDKKVSLLSGGLHSIFEVFDGNILRNIEHVKGKKGIEFVAGDISFLQGTFKPGLLYTGVPFILGGLGGKPDLNLVTFLTHIEKHHIDELSISDLQRKKDLVWGNEGDLPKWSFEDSLHAFAKGIERFQEGKYVSSGDFPHYFTENLMVDFLITRNTSIRKFLMGRNLDSLFTFRQLLKRHLQKIKPDISPRIGNGDMTNIIRSFGDDTIVLDSFLESKDTHIRSFLSGKLDISSLMQDTSPDGESLPISLELPLDITTERNEQILKLRDLYALKIHFGNEVAKKSNFSHLRSFLIDRILEDLMATSPEYNTIVALHQQLSFYKQEDIKKLAREVNNRKKKSKTLENLRKEKIRLQAILKALCSPDDPECQVKMNSQELKKYLRRILRTTQRKKLPTSGEQESVFRLINSEIPLTGRKKKQATRAVEFIYSKILTDEIDKIDGEIQKLTDVVDFKDVSIAFDIKKAINSLLSSLFDEEYFSSMLTALPTYITRAIISSPLSKDNSIESIFKKTFGKVSLLKLSVDYSGLKELIRKYEEFQECMKDFEVYKTIILKDVQMNQNEEYIMKKGVELTLLVENLERLGKEIKLLKGRL